MKMDVIDRDMREFCSGQGAAGKKFQKRQGQHAKWINAYISSSPVSRLFIA